MQRREAGDDVMRDSSSDEEEGGEDGRRKKKKKKKKKKKWPKSSWFIFIFILLQCVELLTGCASIINGVLGEYKYSIETNLELGGAVRKLF